MICLKDILRAISSMIGYRRLVLHSSFWYDSVKKVDHGVVGCPASNWGRSMICQDSRSFLSVATMALTTPFLWLTLSLRSPYNHPWLLPLYLDVMRNFMKMILKNVQWTSVCFNLFWLMISSNWFFPRPFYHHHRHRLPLDKDLGAASVCQSMYSCEVRIALNTR